jgi:hypothetical protein
MVASIRALKMHGGGPKVIAALNMLKVMIRVNCEWILFSFLKVEAGTPLPEAYRVEVSYYLICFLFILLGSMNFYILLRISTW